MHCLNFRFYGRNSDVRWVGSNMGWSFCDIGVFVIFIILLGIIIIYTCINFRFLVNIPGNFLRSLNIERFGVIPKKDRISILDNYYYCNNSGDVFLMTEKVGVEWS